MLCQCNRHNTMDFIIEFIVINLVKLSCCKTKILSYYKAKTMHNNHFVLCLDHIERTKFDDKLHIIVSVMKYLLSVLGK